mgnify:CR=1 FL=1
MKPHGILFNGADVRAILDERKTQARRIVKSNLAGELMIHERECDRVAFFGTDPNNPCNHTFCFGAVKAPHGPVGRKLWVRETFAMGYGQVFYRASEGDDCKAISGAKVPWRPSIHMPQWAARIWLEVTEIRCQRLRDISEADATAEGIESFQDGSGFPDFTEKGIKFRTLETARESFATLWNSICLPPAPVYDEGRQIISYVSYPWAAADFKAVLPEAWDTRIWKGKPLTITSNPWVWAYTFKRIEKP